MENKSKNLPVIILLIILIVTCIGCTIYFVQVTKKGPDNSQQKPEENEKIDYASINDIIEHQKNTAFVNCSFNKKEDLMDNCGDQMAWALKIDSKELTEDNVYEYLKIKPEEYISTVYYISNDSALTLLNDSLSSIKLDKNDIANILKSGRSVVNNSNAKAGYYYLGFNGEPTFNVNVLSVKKENSEYIVTVRGTEKREIKLDKDYKFVYNKIVND